MADEEPQATEQTHPWVNAAFSFVIPSYQIMAARYEAADNRLGALIAWALALTAAIPSVGRALKPHIQADSWWFYLGLAALVVALVSGLIGRRATRLMLADPKVHHTKAGQDTDWEFKRLAIVHAGRHMEANSRALEAKATAEWVGLLAIAAGAWLMTIWIARG